jgi:folate-binding protein YgfZ
MTELILRKFHQANHAVFRPLGEFEAVDHYGDFLAEHAALYDTAGVIDLSFRSRLFVTGADRVRFLNGQVTNNVQGLPIGQGCYAVMLTAKGKLQSDMNIYRLPESLLLDFESGGTATVAPRLEKYIIADDVQVTDGSSSCGLLSVQGPHAAALLHQTGLGLDLPVKPFGVSISRDAAWGELYLVNQPRLGTLGYDWFVPTSALATLVEKLRAAAESIHGRLCGWQALDMARIEAGIPRFSVDMDESNLPLEAGLEERAISFTKGCYIGQEIIARLRAHGQVTKTLRGLQLADDLGALPARGDPLFLGNQEVGYLTSAIASPAYHANLALVYVRREANRMGMELILRQGGHESPARIVALPFEENFA